MTAIEIRSQTVEAIYAAYVEARQDKERNYLGASIIGDPCHRKLFYSFRWVSPPERFDGRMVRLFETGHREEALMIADLRHAADCLGCGFHHRRRASDAPA